MLQYETLWKKTKEYKAKRSNANELQYYHVKELLK